MRRSRRLPHLRIDWWNAHGLNTMGGNGLLCAHDPARECQLSGGKEVHPSARLSESARYNHHMPPRIAIPIPHSGDPEYAERSLPQYERAVELVGGEPVRIPLDQSPATAMKLIERCDAVLLPGSKADVDPAKYDAERHPKTAPADPKRDTVDELLLQDAYNMRKPVLGICYGLQTEHRHKREPCSRPQSADCAQRSNRRGIEAGFCRELTAIAVRNFRQLQPPSGCRSDWGWAASCGQVPRGWSHRSAGGYFSRSFCAGCAVAS